jgi:hypothetical protein
LSCAASSDSSSSVGTVIGRPVPAASPCAPSISVRTDRVMRRLMSHAAPSAAKVTTPRPIRLRRSPAVADA